MDWIDRFAYSNRLRFVHPGQKVALALLVIALCLASDKPLVGLLAAAWMVALAVIMARLPLRVFGGAVFTEGVFLLWAVMGIAVSIHAGGGRWPLTFSITAESLAAAQRPFARALGGAATMAFLAFTTPLVDLLDLGRRVGVPLVLLDLATLIYRFVFVLLESLQRMVSAQETRLGYSNMRRAMHSAALVATRLLVDAYQRSQRLQTALDSRGYAGDLRVLPTQYQHSWPLWWVTAAVCLSLGMVWWLI
ncbi:MAG: Cobalt transport protein CbiQ [Chloroflexi bacterium ADurb.Bin325]|nr:MAG: Cobalt transport protein CbiQ [Chloroflexi bacterium ADurb.Bin325]